MADRNESSEPDKKALSKACVNDARAYLIRERKLVDPTQSQMGELFGVQASMISQVESGDKALDLDKIRTYAKNTHEGLGDLMLRLVRLASGEAAPQLAPDPDHLILDAHKYAEAAYAHSAKGVVSQANLTKAFATLADAARLLLLRHAARVAHVEVVRGDGVPRDQCSRSHGGTGRGVASPDNGDGLMAFARLDVNAEARNGASRSTSLTGAASTAKRADGAARPAPVDRLGSAAVTARNMIVVPVLDAGGQHIELVAQMEAGSDAPAWIRQVLEVFALFILKIACLPAQAAPSPMGRKAQVVSR